MISYYIDGYNLLFRLGTYHSSLQKERERIIDKINEAVGLLKLNVTLIFDAAHTKGGQEAIIHVKNLKIVYTQEGQTADEWIVSSLKNATSTSQTFIVTSDKQLSRYSKDLGAKHITVDEFLSLISTRIRNKKNPKTQKKKIFDTITIPEGKATPPVSPIAPEGSIEYYQQIFEESLPPEDTFKPKKKKAPPKKNLSDAQRWLSIFEDRLKNNPE